MHESLVDLHGTKIRKIQKNAVKALVCAQVFFSNQDKHFKMAFVKNVIVSLNAVAGNNETVKIPFSRLGPP